tara:strand:- start:717 stop:893 length:177 start_codon:yes stop_codon:yes gene_type:complete
MASLSKAQKTKVFQFLQETARVLEDEKRVGNVHFNTEEANKIALQTLKGLVTRLEEEV